MKLLTLSNDLLSGQVLGHAGVCTATQWLAEMFTSEGIEVFEIGFGGAAQSRAEPLSVSAATSLLVAGENGSRQAHARYSGLTSALEDMLVCALQWM